MKMIYIHRLYSFLDIIVKKRVMKFYKFFEMKRNPEKNQFLDEDHKERLRMPSYRMKTPITSLSEFLSHTN